MSNFDGFYGSDNYSGFHNTITVDQSTEVVCHSETIEIVQQQLAVLREYAKKYVLSSHYSFKLNFDPLFFFFSQNHYRGDHTIPFRSGVRVLTRFLFCSKSVRSKFRLCTY